MASGNPENKTENKKPLFRDFNADDEEPETTEIESLCMNCGENGLTKLLLTKIPFYKDVILMSFSCEHCGFENNEIQSSGPIAEKGIRITLEVKESKDLNRQVVKCDHTCIKIPHLDFEIPSQSQKGEITTVEGVIDRAVTGLEQDQNIRRVDHPELAKQIDDFINTLKHLKKTETPFTIIFEDISGNTFVQNPYMPHNDTNCSTIKFVRSQEQNHKLGIYGDTDSNISAMLPALEKTTFSVDDLQSEVLQFNTNCPGCSSPCKTNMKLTNIPYFKEVVIMASVCDLCGLKTNEVKSGRGIEPKGIKIEVKINKPNDLTRDILKSETCSIKIPELDLDVGPSTLGGKFTTVEGILVSMKDQLCESSIAFGDSEEESNKFKMDEFIGRLKKVISCDTPVTIILDDPAGNSYCQSLSPPDPDEGMTITFYERDFQQNEDLGLNDMKTENYESNT